MGVVSSRRRCVLFEERRVSDAVVEFTASWDREHSISASGSATGSAGTAKEGRLESPRSGLFEGGPGENLEITNQSQIFWWVLCTASGVVFIVSAIAKFMLKVSFNTFQCSSRLRFAHRNICSCRQESICITQQSLCLYLAPWLSTGPGGSLSRVCERPPPPQRLGTNMTHTSRCCFLVVVFVVVGV
jgi:hypothetical protein